MTETERCIEKLQWLFDKKNHEMHFEKISWCVDDILVKLSDPSKNFNVTRFLGMTDLMEQICQGVEEASSWKY